MDQDGCGCILILRRGYFQPFNSSVAKKHAVKPCHPVVNIGKLLLEIFCPQHHPRSVFSSCSKSDLDLFVIHKGISPCHPQLVLTFLRPPNCLISFSFNTMRTISFAHNSLKNSKIARLTSWGASMFDICPTFG